MGGKAEKKLAESDVPERGMGRGLGPRRLPFRAEKRNEHAGVLATRQAHSLKKRREYRSLGELKEARKGF